MTAYDLYSWAPLLIAIGVLLIFGYTAWKRRRGAKENLKRIAQRLGFTFSEPETKSSFVRLIGEWEMKGTYSGVGVRIYGKQVSGEERRSESTFIDASANCRTKCELMITRETTLGRIGRALLGLQDVTTGNVELDRRVVVKGVPIHVVKRIVGDDKLQRELVRLFEHEGFIHVDLRGVHYQHSGVFAEERALRELLDALTRTAAALEGAAS